MKFKWNHNIHVEIDFKCHVSLTSLANFNLFNLIANYLLKSQV